MKYVLKIFVLNLMKADILYSFKWSLDDNDEFYHEYKWPQMKLNQIQNTFSNTIGYYIYNLLYYTLIFTTKFIHT